MANESYPSMLYEIKNAFYLGNYYHTINEAQKLKFSNPEHQMEKDIFMYRAYLAQRRNGVVISDINDTSHPELQPFKMLAVYASGKAEKKKDVVYAMEKKMQCIKPEEKTLPFVAAMIYYMEENYDSALRLLHKSDNLECCALSVQIYIKMNRIDLATKEVNTMKEIDEDSTLTQLCQAWLHLAQNGEKLQHAYFILQELSDKYGQTPLLLNGQAAALMALGKYEEAEPLLQEMFDKDPNYPDSLINMLVLSQHLGKNIEVSLRYLNQLKDSHKKHPFVKDFISKEEEFDRLVKAYAPASENE